MQALDVVDTEFTEEIENIEGPAPE